MSKIDNFLILIVQIVGAICLSSVFVACSVHVWKECVLQ